MDSDREHFLGASRRPQKNIPLGQSMMLKKIAVDPFFTIAHCPD